MAEATPQGSQSSQRVGENGASEEPSLKDSSNTTVASPALSRKQSRKPKWIPYKAEISMASDGDKFSERETRGSPYGQLMRRGSSGGQWRGGRRGSKGRSQNTGRRTMGGVEMGRSASIHYSILNNPGGGQTHAEDPSNGEVPPNGKESPDKENGYTYKRYQGNDERRDITGSYSTPSQLQYFMPQQLVYSTSHMYHPLSAYGYQIPPACIPVTPRVISSYQSPSSGALAEGADYGPRFNIYDPNYHQQFLNISSPGSRPSDFEPMSFSPCVQYVYPIQPRSTDSRSSSSEQLEKQLEYYFSVDNLCKDTFLREHMDSEGFVDLEFIFSFSRVRNLVGRDFELLLEAVKRLDSLEVLGEGKEGKVRVKKGWRRWVN